MARGSDVLDTPAIRAHTERIKALQEKERDAQQRLAYVIADIGDELIATKAAIDKADKTAWLRWLADHVEVSTRSAQNYMRVARLRDKAGRTFALFARLGPTALYLIAALPEEIIAKLAKDPRLPSPKSGAMTTLDEMSSRDLEKALEVLLGRRKKSKLPAGSRNSLASDSMDVGHEFLAKIKEVNSGSGKLDPNYKRSILDFIEELREAALHLKAWVTPQKHHR